LDGFMQPAPNQILAAKYCLVRQLGQGGMGSVWLAEHLTLRSPVAIKLIEPSIAANAEALARFLREAQAAASLRSPHVVQILDYGVDGSVPFIAMEVLDGESLATRLERVGRLPPLETARLMNHVARAMSRAHETGVVHRDLKPDNVYIVRNDEEELAKVLDFGVAKSSLHGLGSTASSGTRTGSVLGTPYYMSPEQAEGSKLVDQRTDIWAMGVIAYECLLGVRPFEAETLGSLLLAICAREIPIPSRVGPVPAGFDAWFARACSRDVNLRYGSAKEAVADLRRVCGDPTVVSAGVGYGPAPGLGGSHPGTYSDPGRHPVSYVQAASHQPMLHATTNGLGALSAGTPGIPKNKLSLGVVVGVIAGLLALGIGGGLFFMQHQVAASEISRKEEMMRGVTSAPSLSAAAAPAESARAPTLAAVPAAPDTEAPVDDTKPPGSGTSASHPLPPPAPVAVRPTPRPANPPRPTVNRPPAAPPRPQAAPPPAAPPAPPAPKPGINLGI
jgi:eukaryotic-like serine/threonine-protein kinase